MNDEQSPPLDEQLLPMLLACDQALAAGTVRRELSDPDPPSELRQRLQGNLACIQLLRQVLPGRAAPERVAAPSGLPLRRLGRFEIRRELGHGAFGMVFLATDPRLGREVALKVPRPEGLLTAELRERFVREARAAAGLDHPNVVPVYEAGAEGPLCYIASAYCPGGTLAEWLASRSEAVPLRLAATLVATLAGAVQHAHERGVVHRDLKPSNVLLQGKPRDPTDPNSTVNVPAGGELEFVPRITDFGLAKLTIDTAGQPGEEGGGARTQSGAVLGTPNYMAPEQASGKNKEVGPAADIHALGAILYELLTGLPPFRGETVLDTLERVKNQEPLPFSRLRIRVPRDLETICLKCLQKGPAHRYASAEDLADDLRRFLDGRPIVARPVGVLASAWLWAHRPERIPQAGVFSVALGTVFILWSAMGMALLTSGVFPTETPHRAILNVGGLIGLVYLPLILSGVGTLARKLAFIWLRIGIFLFGIFFSLALIFQDILGFEFDLGGLQGGIAIRATTFPLVCIISLVGSLIHAAALVAYYSNRELMREPRVHPDSPHGPEGMANAGLQTSPRPPRSISAHTD